MNVANWTIVRDDLGGRDLFERRGPGSVVMRWRPSARSGAAEVSINGIDWRPIYGAVPSLRLAEIACDAAIACWRAELATRANPRGPSVAERLGGIESVDGAEGAGRAPRASRAARAARRDEGTRGGREPRRTADDPPPSWVRWDAPEAAALARAHIRSRRSVQGHGGRDDLLGVAVAIVRGFCLLPGSLGKTVLEDWNKSNAIPPWTPQRLARALSQAELVGDLPWGVLFSRTAAGRELVGRWMREHRSAGVRGAGSGGRS